MKKKYCIWTLDHEEIYEPECGSQNAFSFNSGGIKENGFKYCPFCGVKIKQVRGEE